MMFDPIGSSLWWADFQDDLMKKEKARLAQQQQPSPFGTPAQTTTGIQPGGGYIRRDQANAAATTPGPVSPLTTTDYFGLANETNQFMNRQALGSYTANIPGYTANVGKQAGVIGEQLSGSVPQDVINQILQRGAERGIVTGGSGGAGSNASWLRALGQTSTGLQNQGMQNLTQMIASAPIPELFNPASLFIPERWSKQALDIYNQTRQPVTTGNVTTSLPGWSPTYTQFNI